MGINELQPERQDKNISAQHVLCVLYHMYNTVHPCGHTGMPEWLHAALFNQVFFFLNGALLFLG